jgi:NADH-quinone oxidoreductase subunit K
MTITPQHYILLSLILFGIGVVGVLTRRNAIVVMMSIELILNAANLNFVAFSRRLAPAGVAPDVAGHVFSLFIIAVAAAEAAIGLAIVISLMRSRESINIDEIDLLKG